MLNKSIEYKVLNKINNYFNHTIFNDTVEKVKPYGTCLSVYLTIHKDKGSINLNTEELDYLIAITPMGEGTDYLYQAIIANDVGQKKLTADNFSLLLDRYKDKLQDCTKLSNIIFSRNEDLGLNFTPKQFDFIIKNVDLHRQEVDGVTVLMDYIKNSFEQEIVLSPNTELFLLKNSDLNMLDNSGDNALIYALYNNMTDSFELHDGSYEYLFMNTDLSSVSSKIKEYGLMDEYEIIKSSYEKRILDDDIIMDGGFSKRKNGVKI